LFFANEVRIGRQAGARHTSAGHDPAENPRN